MLELKSSTLRATFSTLGARLMSVEMDGVDMVTDVLNSGVALAVAKVTQEKNRIMINGGAASTRLTNEDCTPNTVHYVYDTYALANGTGRAVVKQGGDAGRVAGDGRERRNRRLT